MSDQKLESQAKKYANELNTFAYEYGFSSQEGWCLIPASEAKKVEVEKKYYPSLSTSIIPDTAEEFLELVLSKIKHINNDGEKETISHTINKNTLYLTAYNPNRKV